MDQSIFYTMTRIELEWTGFEVLLPGERSCQLLRTGWHVTRGRVIKEVQQQYPGAVLVSDEQMRQIRHTRAWSIQKNR